MNFFDIIITDAGTLAGDCAGYKDKRTVVVARSDIRGCRQGEKVSTEGQGEGGETRAPHHHILLCRDISERLLAVAVRRGSLRAQAGHHAYRRSVRGHVQQ